MTVIGKGRDASNIVNIPLERFKIGLTGRELLDIAEKERSLNPLRYGGTPLVGRGSDPDSKSLIFEAISYSSDFSSILSGPDPIQAKQKVLCSTAGQQLYFLLTGNNIVDLTE